MPAATDAPLAPQAGGADPTDVAALRRTAASLDGGVVLVGGPDPALAYAVTLATALEDATQVSAHRSGLDATADAGLDVHPGAPAGSSWTVAEVEQLILAPARLRPMHRAHIVVADAHRMAQIAGDRLLKALEEPAVDVVFWLCAPGIDALPATLASRVSKTHTVRPLPHAQRLGALVTQGLDAQAAAAILNDARDNVRLAFATAKHDLAPHLSLYAHLPARVANGDVHAPSTDADAVTAAIATLAAGLSATRKLRTPPAQTDARAAWEKLDTHGKVEGRALVRDLIDRCAHATQTALAGAATARDVRRIDMTLHACAAARAELDTNAHPATVMSALLARAQVAGT